MGLELRSTAFEAGDMIPVKHTCDGPDLSPPLAWVGAPEDAEAFTVVMEDIDSVKGIWSHWVLYDVPPDVNALAPGISPSRTLPWGGVQGLNDFGRIGYGGPCPSDGKSHRYVVRLFAVDKRLGLSSGATRDQVLDAMDGHMVAQASLEGRYERLADR